MLFPIPSFKYTFWGKVAGVNFIISVRFLLDLTQIFLPMNVVGNSVLGKLCMRKQSTKTTVPLDVLGELRILFLEGVTRSSKTICSSVKINSGTNNRRRVPPLKLVM